MLTQKEFIIHACEQVLRFGSVDSWDNLSEELKVQLGFNMGVVALGLKLTKEEGYLAMADMRRGNLTMGEFRNHFKKIIEAHDIEVDESNVSRTF